MNNGSSLGEDACWLNRRIQSRSSLIPPQPGPRLESRAVARLNVRFGSKADMCSAQADVRFVPIADIAQRAP